MLDIQKLFDANFYLAQNPDVLQAVKNGTISSGLDHFIKYGQFEKRDPSAFFNTNFYLSQNADVAAAVTSGKISAVDHFIKYGEIEGRDPISEFNTSYYLSKNSDVAAAVNQTSSTKDPLTGIQHYVLYGQYEGRNPSTLYNDAFYQKQNPDVATAVQKKQITGIQHFIQFGEKEGRIGKRNNVIIFVADGLRQSSVNPTDSPTLYALRQNGVNFVNSHSLFPTFTTPNASAIATGHYLGDTGDFSNTIYTGIPIPNANGSITPFIESDPVLADIDEKFPGQNFLDEESVLAAARQAGLSTAAVGKLGPVLIQDVTQGNRVNGAVPPPSTIVIDDSTGQSSGVPLNADITARLQAAGLPTATPGRGANGSSGTNTTPGTTVANVSQQQFFADATTKAILPLFKDRGQPFAMVYWSRDPDGTQHNEGDSLNSLTPGINGPSSKAAVKNADTNLKQLIDALQAQGLADSTDIIVTSDHGFSTISKHEIDNTGTKFTTSYAASLSYPGVNPGFLPKGFVAIDLAKGLNLPLFDPDTPTAPLANGNIQYTAVDPTQGQLSKSGNGLIGGTGKVTNNQTDAKVVVAANGGSDLIYLPSGDKNLAAQVVDFLTKQDYVSGVFADDAFGNIPGALPLSSINLKGSALTPVPAIVVNFKTFASDSNNPSGTGVEIADTSLQEGQGMHGSFSRSDTYNNMAAIGPDFKAGFLDSAPVSNADVGTTAANILGLNIPQKGNLVGRVMNESLFRGPNTVSSTSGTLQSDPAANGLSTILNYQQVGQTKYFDVAGFPGRTLGL